MTIPHKLILTGTLGALVLNPLSTNIIADIAITAINYALKYMVLGSGYAMVASATLVAVGVLLMYVDSKQSNTKKLKKLKTTKTSRAGEFLEA